MIRREYKKGEIFGDFRSFFHRFASRIHSELSVNQFAVSDIAVSFDGKGEMTVHAEKKVVRFEVARKYNGATFSLCAEFAENVLSSPNAEERTYQLESYSCDMSIFSRVPLSIEIGHFIHLPDPPIGSRVMRCYEGDIILYCDFPIIEEMLSENGVIKRMMNRNKSTYVSFETLDIALVDEDTRKRVCSYDPNVCEEYMSITDHIEQKKLYEISLSYNLCEDTDTREEFVSIFVSKLPISQFRILEQMYFTLEELGDCS